MSGPAASSRLANKRRRWLVLGDPENRRTALFQAALRELRQPEAEVIRYRALLREEVDLAEVLARQTDAEPCVLRIESPAEDFDTERRLIALGEPVGDISRSAALRLRSDFGRVRFPRQWFAGYCALLEQVEQAMEPFPHLRVQNHPSVIPLLFDKPRCHALLESRGVAVPPALPGITCYDSLRAAMQSAGWNRVFAKLACGSSASGVVAFSIAGVQPCAITSLELVRRRGEARFYNNLKLSHYHRERDLRAIFDFIGEQGMHVERWLPKAVQNQRSFDLRVVTYAGQARHTVVRTSRAPMTNLHLGNRRGDLAQLRRAAGPRWRKVTELCELAASQFPQAQYIGWDVLVTPGFRRAYILEGNAFGDLLPGITYRGRSTHAASIQASLRD